MMTKENDKVDHDSQDLGAAGADKVCTSSHSTSWGEAAAPAPSKRHLEIVKMKSIHCDV